MGNNIFRISNFTKTVNYLKKNGVRHAYYAARERIEEERKADYFYREPSADTLEAQRAETADYSELFSIVVPAYETEERFLREMIDSVCRQSYPGWELIIVDAGSSDTVEETVREITDTVGEKRIRYSRLTENKGISDNTNAGIGQAAGDYVALLDHDDLLAPDALYYMVKEIRNAKQQGVTPALLYTDEDKYENDNKGYLTPHRKDKLNLDLI
ncbi:MAG: glycosyltransferase, partial [Lachnospiraceae bacterium]|nr:glycosyltransferase [Lachnospiraceae bacterium]